VRWRSREQASRADSRAEGFGREELRFGEEGSLQDLRFCICNLWAGAQILSAGGNEKFELQDPCGGSVILTPERR
jgi:hypothetical protein